MRCKNGICSRKEDLKKKKLKWNARKRERKRYIFLLLLFVKRERDDPGIKKYIKRKTFRRWLFEFQTLRLLWLLLEGDNMFLFFFFCSMLGSSQPAPVWRLRRKTHGGWWLGYGKRKKENKRNLSGSPHVGEALCHWTDPSRATVQPNSACTHLSFFLRYYIILTFRLIQSLSHSAWLLRHTSTEIYIFRNFVVHCTVIIIELECTAFNLLSCCPIDIEWSR